MQCEGDMIEVFNWMQGFNTGDFGKVLKVSSQGKTGSNGFRVWTQRDGSGADKFTK